MDWKELAKKAGISIPELKYPERQFKKGRIWFLWHTFVALIPVFILFHIRNTTVYRYGEIGHEVQRVKNAYYQHLMKEDTDILLQYFKKKGNRYWNIIIQRKFTGERLRLSKYLNLNKDYHKLVKINNDLDKIIEKKEMKKI